jgi:ATP-dependent DNA helicase RecG
MATKTKLDPRKLMEKAIAVMKESINEPRADGKASPLVGAVLWKPDGPAETAHRGELREGDHAEFTLLERKNRANKLDGCILFATLEPCAPGARNHPKLSCAERIVNTRIKEVWVGIEDPDPTVDRKGIKFLQDHGVTVHMFERDLQEEIQTANKEFIAQALARRAAAEEAGGEVVLSTLENPVATADLRDFSTEALERYRSIAKIGEAVKSEAFQRKLVQQGLMKVEGKKAMPAGFGMLLFGKSPRDVMPQAGLLGTIHWPDGTEEVRDFDGPMMEVPGQAIQWLKDKLPNPISRSGAQRREANEKFYELVREGIVNALVHRNYDVAGAKSASWSSLRIRSRSRAPVNRCRRSR